MAISLSYITHRVQRSAWRRVDGSARRGPQGDVLAVARLAGIQGAKHTALLIPLCHNIFISGVKVDVRLDHRDFAVDIRAQVTVITPQAGPAMCESSVHAVHGDGEPLALILLDVCRPPRWVPRAWRWRRSLPHLWLRSPCTTCARRCPKTSVSRR